MNSKKMKAKEKDKVEKEKDQDEVQEDKQISFAESENKSDIEEGNPVKKKVTKKFQLKIKLKGTEEEEVEHDKVEDNEVQKGKKETDEESEEENEIKKKGKKSGFMLGLDLLGQKMKRVREKEDENKQETDEESEEESETEEEEEKKSPKKMKMEEKTEKKISNEKSNQQFSLTSDEDDEDDCEDDAELQYDSDGSLIDDDGTCGLITNSTKCQLSLEEKQKLEKLCIQLNHKVLPQHKIEKTAGTRVLTKEEKAKFEKYAELRTGKYLPHENKILRGNWKDFCIANKWNVNNPRPFLQMRYKNKVAFIDFKERMKFIQFLANGLKNRSLYSVFNRFKILYDPHKVSRYSTREDDIILEYVRRYKVTDHERDRKFAELALMLKRTRASVWRRYRVLKKQHNLPADS